MTWTDPETKVVGYLIPDTIYNTQIIGNLLHLYENAPGPQGVYDSGWFAVTSNTTYTKAHSLGGAPILVQVMFSTTASPGAADKRYVQYGLFNGTDFENFIYHDETNVVLKIQNGPVIDHTDLDANSGYARILAWL